MPHVQTEGARLYYEVSGEGAPLVFAHGIGGNHASWFQQVPFFSRSYQVVTFDHRGFGNSEEEPEGAGRAAFVDDLRALLDELAIERASLVAQSMGGGTCLGFAVRYPERVKALVLADTAVGVSAGGRLGERLQAVREATQNLAQLDRVLSKGFVKRNAAMAALYLQIASFNRANRFNLRGRAEPITEADLRALPIPVLFLVGEEDVLYPPDVIEMAAALVPGAELALVPDAAHSVYFEQPDVFNYQVQRFLKSAGALD